ncbi:hypothetical protein [Ferrovibrio sp.]|uniref:hypothetical protein n=1 Tax=Ferrovibrio sp. TaxID=1917215 RepID=UPI0035173205
MANRPDIPSSPLRPQQALERARSDLSRLARGSAPASSGLAGSGLVGNGLAGDGSAHEAPARELPAAVPGIATAPSGEDSALAARIDLLRARLGQARGDAVSALLFLGDAQQDCDALTESCARLGWPMLAEGIALLSSVLRRALPSEDRHLALVGLLIDALYALRRAEQRADMGQAGQDLLRGLRLAVAREFGRHNG